MQDIDNKPPSQNLTLFTSHTSTPIEDKLDKFISAIGGAADIFNGFLFPVFTSQPDEITRAVSEGRNDSRRRSIAYSRTVCDATSGPVDAGRYPCAAARDVRRHRRVDPRQPTARAAVEPYP